MVPTFNCHVLITNVVVREREKEKKEDEMKILTAVVGHRKRED